MSSEQKPSDERIREIVQDELNSDTENVISSIPFSRREVLEGVSILGLSVAGAGLGTYGAVGRAAAQTSSGQGTIGTEDNPLEEIYVNNLYNTTDNISADSISTRELNNTYRIRASDGESRLLSVLDAAGQNDRIIFDPGASITVTQQLDFPSHCRIEGTASADGFATPTITKGFNGDLATYGNFLTLDGIAFEGDSANYSGSGLVPRQSARGLSFHKVGIRDMADAGLVIDETYLSWFAHCDFNNNGVGMREDDAGQGHSPHNVWVRCRFAFNDQCGIEGRYYLDTNGFYGCSIDDNSGPGIDLSNASTGSPWSSVIDGGTKIFQNDGPGILIGGTDPERLVLAIGQARVTNNAQNPDTSLTTPVGDIHAEDGQRISGTITGRIGDIRRQNSTTQFSTLTIHGITGDLSLPNINCVITNMSQVGSIDSINKGIGLDPEAEDTVALSTL